MVEQPQFDDERTILRARPVVPLQRIDAKVKHRRRWFLGGAFAVAMLLGAGSALLSAYFKFRNVPDPEIQTLSALPAPEVVLPVVEEKIPERPKPKSRVRNTINPNHTNHTDPRPRLSEDEELRRIRDAVLVDEWQERRQRRVERRERRRSERSGRDLSQLDEIFEGPRRPR